MAAWALAHPPWPSLSRVRLRWDMLAAVKPRPWISTKQFLSTPSPSTETPMMREMKAYPYPSDAPDSSLFEDTTHDYHEAALDTHSAAELYPVAEDAGEPGSMLKQLIKAGRLADANRVREELVNLGVEIPLHPVYHFAARQAMRDPNLSQKERVVTVLSWWSLFPPRSSGIKDLGRSIHSMLAEILRNDIAPDIPLLISWSLLAASKGFADRVRNYVIPAVARYAPAQSCKTFVERFCASFQEYETALVKSGALTQFWADCVLFNESKLCYSLAVQELLLAGKVDAAWDVLCTARSLSLPIPTAIAKEVMSKKKEGNAVEDAVPRTKVSWLNGVAKRESLDPIPLPSSVSQKDLHALLREKLREPGAPVRVARALKKAFKAGSPPIPANRLAELIGGYLALRRITLIRRLRTIAYKHEHLVSLWALAEMSRLGSSHSSIYAIMKEFESHFHVVGVPRRLFDALWQERRTKAPAEVAQWRPPLRWKLTPTFYHTHFVWSTVLDRARTSSQVQHLYVQFLEDVAASREFPLSSIPYMVSRGILQPTVDPEDYIRPIPPPILFHGRHFAPFIRAFTRLGLLPLATRVLIDMYALGIRPDDQELFHEFIHALPSSTPDMPLDNVVANLEKLLDRVDMRRFRDDPPSPSDGQSSRTSSPADPLKTEMRAFIYVAALRRLLLDGQGTSQNALEIARRFERTVPYRTKSNAIIDQVFRDLIAAITTVRETAHTDT
ncbi:hypothetical protein PYCCODRAFT_1445691 [Trametes coccinea BRFM310]|uniref:Uncharacterized protein n=1 Tax=Trametes coccinea (strain BRFM310) TaxID=1353009 RepID=A0A1Y2IJV8_TRAC3|nr:hypothetical protein PYCCODRAFT_1445691 [Trametes coccinea BRFM310]